MKTQIFIINNLRKCQIFDMFVLYNMSKYIKQPFDEKDLGKNPFLNSLVVPVNKVASTDRYKQDGEEWYKSGYEYDASEYTKVFISAKNRELMVSLSPRGKDLYVWIVYEAEKNKDYLWLNKERYMEECKISSMNTYKSALNELIKQGFLVKTVVSNVVWLNPQYFFNGNRIKSFPDNVKIK